MMGFWLEPGLLAGITSRWRPGPAGEVNGEDEKAMVKKFYDEAERGETEISPALYIGSP